MANSLDSAEKTDVNDIVGRLGEFDPASLYEAAGQTGMVDPRIRPAWPSAKICGLALTVCCPPGDNLMLHVAVAHAFPGAVLVATTGPYLLAGAWGEVLTAAAQARGVTGLVIDGAVRDIEAIRDAQFPVFARGCAIGSCTKDRVGRLNVPVQVGGCTVHPGDAVVGDGDGLVVVSQACVSAVYEAAMQRRQREEEIIVELRRGRTTLELLGLVDPLAAAKGTGRKDG